MSGYNPFGFSPTLAYFMEATSGKKNKKDGKGKEEKDKDKKKESKENVKSVNYVIYFLLRLALAVDSSLIFELMGAFVLTQFNYKGFDFNTHKKGEAIVFIGCIGGLVNGVALIIADVIMRGQNKINDSYHVVAKGGINANKTKKGPNRDTILAGCVFRLFLWPACGAAGGAAASLIWHAAKNPKLKSKMNQRAATGAIVQAVGAGISAPSIIQFILIAFLSLAEGWESDEDGKEKKTEAPAAT